MSRTFIALVGLVAAIGAGGIGYLVGEDHGRRFEAGERDGKVAGELRLIIDKNKGLAEEAIAASRRLRAATAQRAQQDARTTQEFKDALATTSASRAGCVFPDGVMRDLDAAHDRAAQAAAGGTRATVRAAPAPARREDL